jgi:ankyrin repeat protein
VKPRQLIRKGYDPDKHDLPGCKIIHIAAGMGAVSIVELLLEAWAQINVEALE